MFEKLRWKVITGLYLCPLESYKFRPDRNRDCFYKFLAAVKSSFFLSEQYWFLWVIQRHFNNRVEKLSKNLIQKYIRFLNSTVLANITHNIEALITKEHALYSFLWVAFDENDIKHYFNNSVEIFAKKNLNKSIFVFLTAQYCAVLWAFSLLNDTIYGRSSQ